MAGVARKAPAKRKTKSPSSGQKILQASWVDRLMHMLPFSEQDVQRVISWIILAAITLLAFAAAQYAGLTAAAYQQYAALAAKAGFQVQRVEVTGVKRFDQRVSIRVSINWYLPKKIVRCPWWISTRCGRIC